MSKRYWVVRAYVDSDDSDKVDWDICRDNNFVAIGWDWAGNLIEASKDIELLKEKLGYKSKYKTANVVHQILRFINEIKKGDIVILPTYPEGDIVYYIGEVVSDAYYDENPSDGAYSKTRRKVRWLARVNRDDISEKLKRSLYGQMTVFNIDKHKAEIEKLIEANRITDEQPEPEDEIGEDKINEIVDKLRDMDPFEFEELVVELLNLSRDFTAVKTRNTSDGGVDFVCINDRGDVIYKGQVKDVSRPIGISEILMLRGTLNQNQKGIFVTTSRFTQNAAEEAHAPGKAEIELIGRRKLSELISEYYNDLSEKFRKKIRLAD